LKRLVSRHGLGDRVRFVEQSVPEAQVADYYSACNAFVFPNDQQSWGAAPLEALSCHRPVIVSRGSGVHEVLRDGETALLVPPRDPEALASAMARMMSNPSLAARIAERGCELVLSQFTWKHFTAAMAQLMERTCEQARAAKRRMSPAAQTGAPWATRLIAKTEPFWRIR
jgi:glycosyltransferase involved in cell wall biosynthesis